MQHLKGQIKHFPTTEKHLVAVSLFEGRIERWNFRLLIRASSNYVLSVSSAASTCMSGEPISFTGSLITALMIFGILSVVLLTAPSAMLISSCASSSRRLMTALKFPFLLNLQIFRGCFCKSLKSRAVMKMLVLVMSVSAPDALSLSTVFYVSVSNQSTTCCKTFPLHPLS